MSSAGASDYFSAPGRGHAARRAQHSPAYSLQTPPTASGLSPVASPEQLLHTQGCMRQAACQVPRSSRKPLQQSPTCLTVFWKQDRLARRLGRAEPHTVRGQRGSSCSRASLRRSGSYPPHAPLHPWAPSAWQASAQECRACCSSTCNYSQILALALRRCPRLYRPPGLPIGAPVTPWCQHSSNRPRPSRGCMVCTACAEQPPKRSAAITKQQVSRGMYSPSSHKLYACHMLDT